MQRVLIIILFLFISVVSDAQSKISHQVVKGETLYSIAKKYHVSVDAIQKANTSVGGDLKLKVGQTLLIPSALGAKTTAPKATPEPQREVSPSSGASTHIVVKGETAYGIAKANGLTPKQLKDANHLPDNMTLKLGQKLIIPSKNQEAMYKPIVKEVKQEPASTSQPAAIKTTTEQGRDYLTAHPPVIEKEPVKQEKEEPKKSTEPKPTMSAKEEHQIEVVREENKVTPSLAVPKSTSADIIKNENLDPNDYSNAFAKESEAGKKKVTYRGISTFMQSENPGNQFLALYNYADMGAILKVTNLMSKVTIYVKVIGKVPAGDAQNDVILKVSGDAATKLKVSEDKFLVEVTGYNMP